MSRIILPGGGGGGTITTYASGTQAATVTTEHFLSSPNTSGTFTLHVDTINMVAGDILQLRVYQMVLTGGTTRVVFVGQWAGLQAVDDLIKVSLAIANELTDTNALRFSLLQSAGTSRNFPWKVLKYT